MNYLFNMYYKLCFHSFQLLHTHIVSRVVISQYDTDYCSLLIYETPFMKHMDILSGFVLNLLVLQRDKNIHHAGNIEISRHYKQLIGCRLFSVPFHFISKSNSLLFNNRASFYFSVLLVLSCFLRDLHLWFPINRASEDAAATTLCQENSG